MKAQFAYRKESFENDNFALTKEVSGVEEALNIINDRDFFYASLHGKVAVARIFNARALYTRDQALAILQTNIAAGRLNEDASLQAKALATMPKETLCVTSGRDGFVPLQPYDQVYDLRAKTKLWPQTVSL